jgi:hypothetical protein
MKMVVFTTISTFLGSAYIKIHLNFAVIHMVWFKRLIRCTNGMIGRWGCGGGGGGWDEAHAATKFVGMTYAVA